MFSMMASAYPSARHHIPRNWSLLSEVLIKLRYICTVSSFFVVKERKDRKAFIMYVS